MTQVTFDLSLLQHICANWSAIEASNFSTALSKDGIYERIKQVLVDSKSQQLLSQKKDFIPLIRQVLVREAKKTNVQRLRVPLGEGWPSPDEWRASGFSAVDHNDQSILISANEVTLKWLIEGGDLLSDAFAEVPSRVDLSVTSDPFLESAIGFKRYHAEGQREALRALFQMPKGDTLIANLPTGSGKSLLAQTPVLVGGIEGSLTVVVVPTIALALDQAARMADLLRRRFPTWKSAPLAYYGGASSENRSAIRSAIRNGVQGIVFTSPESICGSLQVALHTAAESGCFHYLVIDEAHLVSAWGDAFRPSFQMLPAVRRSLLRAAGERAFKTVLASATLTADTIEILQLLFGPLNRTQVVSAVHLRAEPRYWSYKATSNEEQLAKVLGVIAVVPRPYILYFTERKKAADFYHLLRQQGYTRIRLFHGGTEAVDREQILREWNSCDVDGIVATSAFGLGVDKADIRTVIHATLPESLDRFYQEVGRGGRDGNASASLMIFTDEDVVTTRGISEPTMIRNETGLDRWSRLFYASSVHPRDPTRRIVNLDVLPAHLRQTSDANRTWNLRTLTLMARAGLIELDSTSRASGISIEESTDAEKQAEIGIRVLNPQHLQAERFSAAMDRARSLSLRSTAINLDLMLKIANRQIEVGEALAQIYSVLLPGATTIVEPHCSGCAIDWRGRKSRGLYPRPVLKGASRFSDVAVSEIKRQWPQLSGNSLYVVVPSDTDYERAVSEVIRLALLRWPLQQLVMSDACSIALQSTIRSELSRIPNRPIFVDVWSRSQLEEIVPFPSPVRAVILEPKIGNSVPSGFMLSPVTLQLAILSSETRDQNHPLRRFADVTPGCVRFEEFRRIATI